MIKAGAVLFLLAFTLLATADALQQRFVPRRGLARQVQAEPPNPSPTGYPEAGITPEVPFELPSSTAQPEVSYLPPDNTYGPPLSGDAEVPQPETDDIPATEEEDLPPSDAKLVPSPDEEDVLVQVSDDGSVIAVSTTLDQPESGKSARIYQRFPQGRRRQQPVPQRLVLHRNW
ncbi:CG14569 [Drosophila busckii]|uniref:CG14569 n=1 Tax=Drosophila busckii TaxID=30019 RepID=A0A0M4EC95_DROBS|nr:uncharacterized protein LOC108599410 [Drosophila busckii]ALC45228.1 CG14569 [Drosophila busckii]